MLESAHTPGPWHLTLSGFGVTVWAGPESSPVIIADSGEKSPEAIANGRLIAAAPDILHALEMVRDANKSDPHIPSVALATIEAAIAKATGAFNA